MNAPEPYEMKAWVEAAPANQKELRQAVHVVLGAITQNPFLRDEMVMKGGMLMAIRYRSPRFTKDVDFSSSHALQDVGAETVAKALEAGLAVASHQWPYGLDCRVHSYKVNPPRADATFPSIELKIGYAYRGTPRHLRLLKGQSPNVLSIDFSLNETILAVEDLKLETGLSIRAYALTDLIAEKLRSLLQQIPRNRYRRQDVYDLSRLLDQEMTDDAKGAVMRSLMEKAASRGITPLPGSLADPEVKEHAQRDYLTLADEVAGELPDFNASYEKVKQFYESLPWRE